MASNLKKQVTNIYPQSKTAAKKKSRKKSVDKSSIKALQNRDLNVVDILLESLEEMYSINELDLKTASAILNQLISTRKNILSYYITEEKSNSNWINTMQIRDLHGKSI